MSRHDSRDLSLYCRLFIIGPKGFTNEHWKEEFSRYGNIQDVVLVKDRRTGEEKGFVYITFSKPSEAALALEEMNGAYVFEHDRPIKVVLANDKNEGNVRDPRENEKMLRVFIMVPTDFTEKDIKEIFKDYGDVQSVQILRHKNSNESKGLAFVSYKRPYHAALAVENAERKYKAVFAAVRGSGDRGDGPGGRWGDDNNMPRGRFADRGRDRLGRIDQSFSPPRYDRSQGRGGAPYDRRSNSQALSGGGLLDPMNIAKSYPAGQDSIRNIEIMACHELDQASLYKLLDLIPGLETCAHENEPGLWVARYASGRCASYAVDKLNGFEYPSGFRLGVRLQSGASAPGGRLGGDYLQSLVQSIQEATSILKTAGVDIGGAGLDIGMTSHAPYHEDRRPGCDLNLPPPQPLVPMGVCEERLFIVSQPGPIPDYQLERIFSCFGNLIEAKFKGNRNIGYAKFASKDSAHNAIEALHGQVVYGSRLKVMIAEPTPADHYEKRLGKRPRD